MKDSASNASPVLWSISDKRLQYGAALVVLVFATMTPKTLLSFLLHTFFTTIGVALGIGFGLGLAMHVYQTLNGLQQSHDEQKLARTDSSFKPRSTIRGQTASILEDGSTYSSLMESAGYSMNHRVLRAQVIKKDHESAQLKYPFTGVVIERQCAVVMMQDDWPSLPKPVATELGRFIEHVMRDYVSGWFSSIDSGCKYRIEKQKRAEGIERDGGGTQDKGSNSEDAAVPSDNTEHPTGKRMMALDISQCRSAPFLDSTYKVLSHAFGNLALRAEHVNLWSLALLKWPHVLAHTFKVYRQMRKSAIDKKTPNSGAPTEMEVTREYLLARKLHRAVTFGLDVPSLLFADPTGTEYSEKGRDQDTILQERLIDSGVLKDCELDYNRVLGHRLCRALLPRQEFNTPVISGLVIEIFASCVLQPLMNLFTPISLNSWLVMGMNSMEKAKATEAPQDGSETDSPKDTPNDAPSTDVDPKSASSSNDISSSMPTDYTSSMPSDAPVTTEDGLGNNATPTGAKSAGNSERNMVEEDVMTLDKNSRKSSKSFSSQRTLSAPDDLSTSEHYQDQWHEQQKELIDMQRSQILTLMSIAVFEVHQHEQFSEHTDRASTASSKATDSGLQSAILKLVLTIELALLHGRCLQSGAAEIDLSGDDSTFTEVLMEMTSDIDAFEEKLAALSHDDETPAKTYTSFEKIEPEDNEIATIRTLISTWLHTGQIYKALLCISKAIKSQLSPFFSPDAFLNDNSSVGVILQQLKVFDGAEVLVEMADALASQRLELKALEYDDDPPTTPRALRSKSMLGGGDGDDSPVQEGSKRKLAKLRSNLMNRLSSEESTAQSSHDVTVHQLGSSAVPRHLDFHRNAAFASSLRTERERRLQSWETKDTEQAIKPIQHKGASNVETELFLELHNLARIFYSGTNMMAVRDAARRKDAEAEEGTSAEKKSKVALLTVEMAGNRRRIEVPDDDSSFLLKAQPRSLNPVSVHRDDRNHEMSYKCYMATYEEPAITPGTNKYNGGRFIRRCLLHYYPIDRTASITLHNDARKLDKRKGKANGSENVSPASSPYISGAFLRERHLCQKWTMKGVASQGFLSSTVMETSDFNAVPRTGKAVDFVCRMSLFEKPVVDLAGKRFTIYDSSARGPHRADASALEISDPALSALLLSLGKDWEAGAKKPPVNDSDAKISQSTDFRNKVEMGPDGYPMLFMKFSNKQGDSKNVEIKPYRLSFVRAAILVTSARQEAQLQCLMECVRAGSAKSATKARTDAQLKQTLKILEFASDARSSSVLRDLKLGVYHIDRDQLRRNGLLLPRSPTIVRDIRVKVEASAAPRDLLKSLGPQSSSTLYKIRCSATIELDDKNQCMDNLEPYLCSDGTTPKLCKEEWTVYRSMRDFQAFHKHLKTQVAPSEASASTGSRIVGAAAAAFTAMGNDRRQRRALIPSLAQASKTGAIAATKKAISKRGDLLDEYLQFMLSPNHILSRCSELLLFIGAYHPFPDDVHVGRTPIGLVDPLGRSELSRSILVHGEGRKLTSEATTSLQSRDVTFAETEAASIGGTVAEEGKDSRASLHSEQANNASTEAATEMLESIVNKIDQVALGEVRNRFVELIRFQFGFENASFLRSRMLSALEAASFVAVTKASEFRKTLYGMHMKHLNADSLAGWIQVLLNILWPNGVWLEYAKPLTEQEERDLKAQSLEKLIAGFPEQIRSILGTELTRDGLEILHEMLQNRIVVKSLFYMLFDILWIEIFPELRDVLTCASALNI